MAQEGFVKLKENWVAFADIVTPTADTLYFIQNRGYGYLLAQESASAPTKLEGVIIPPYKVLKYIKGTDNLYIRSLKGTCSANITSEG